MDRKIWKSLLIYRENKLIRKALLVGFIASLALILAAFGIGSHLTKDVTVKLNGVEQAIETEAETVEELLNQLDVSYTSFDYIHPELHTPLTDGLFIEWRKAVPIHIDLYGQKETRWTLAETVDEFIQTEGLSLKEGTVIQPAEKARVQPNMHIEIAQWTEEIVEEEIISPYQTLKKADATLAKGQQRVMTKGRDGKALQKTKIVYKNGQEISRELIATEVIEERRDEVIAVGTITTVARGNYVFSPRAVLDNVTLTAYSAGEEHTGKTPDHPQYGITRSGTRATDGQTIAVDPKLIPLGSWVYIDGIGLRKAEDTGGAVKGKKIDLYYEDNEEAKKFGTKKGYKVFVLGKQKPTPQ